VSSKQREKSRKNHSVAIENRKARYDFSIEDTTTCGIVLTGTEVKSIRTGKAQLKDSFAKIEKGEVWLYNCHISPYQFGNRFNHPPIRKRKLLLHKKEILRIYNKIREKNLTLIPLKIFFSNNWAKLELGLGRGKKIYDKRDAIKKKELQRTIKEIKSKYK